MRYAWRCAGLLLVSRLTLATEFPGLYEADVVIPSKDDAVRDEAFRRGIGVVIGRVVRSADQGSAPVKAILAHSEAYVLQYEFTGSSGDGDLRIKLHFDETRIRRELDRKGIRTWGPDRPETLLWLVQDDGTGPRLLGTDARTGYESGVREAAAVLGLPLQLPLGDLEDQQALAAADLVSGNAERIRRASNRYESPVILTGVLRRQSPSELESAWRVYVPGGEDRWTAPAAPFPQAVAAGLAGTYGRLAEQLKPPNAKSADYNLKILGVASVEDIKQVSAHLASLPPVTQVQWLAVGNGEATFRVKASGGRPFLERTLRFGRLLRPETADGNGGATLTCRLQK